MSYLNYILPALEHYQFFLYLIVFLLSLAESVVFVGVLIPGALITFFWGVLAADGYLNLSALFFVVTLGVFLGEIISFHLGLKGTKLFNQDNKIFKSSYLERGKTFFERHGSKSIFLGRFIGPIKIINPFVAGLSKMERKKFIALNLLSIFIWVFVYIILGFFFGNAWVIFKLWSTRAELFLFSLIAFLFLLYYLKKFLQKHGEDLLSFLKSIWQSMLSAIKNNPDVKNFASRHSKFLAFAGRRLERKNFSSLPLTLFTIIFFYALLLFLGLAEDIITSDIFSAVDLRIDSLFWAIRSPLFVKIFLWLTVLGKWQVVLAFAAALSLLLWLIRSKRYLLPLWLSLAGNFLFIYFGKIAIHRSRPINSYYFEPSFSFPSSHAAVAMVLFGFFAYFFWQNFKQWKHRLNAVFFALIVIFLVGFSRLYLGVHYASDVLGGYLLGFLWLIVGISLSEWLKFNYPRASREKIPGRLIKYLLPIIILPPLLFYAGYASRFNPRLNPPKLNLNEPQVTESILNEFDQHNLSRYSEKLDGSPQEPLSFIISAESDRSLTEAFKKAGWYAADQISLNSVFKIARAAISNSSYPSAPMTPSFWQAEVNTFAFEKPTSGKNVKQRHHARFWRSGFKTPNGKNIYVGTASFDIGLKWVVTHKISPDIDTGREFLFKDLNENKTVAGFSKHKFVDPILGSNFSGDPFFTDGQLYIADLK